MIDETSNGTPRAPLRTSDVARASGYSVQQVRDLERLGVIPPATRSPNGFRSYAAVHVHALGAYRGLAGAVGAVAARSCSPSCGSADRGGGRRDHGRPRRVSRGNATRPCAPKPHFARSGPRHRARGRASG